MCCAVLFVCVMQDTQLCCGILSSHSLSICTKSSHVFKQFTIFYKKMEGLYIIQRVGECMHSYLHGFVRWRHRKLKIEEFCYCNTSILYSPCRTLPYFLRLSLFCTYISKKKHPFIRSESTTYLRLSHHADVPCPSLLVDDARLCLRRTRCSPN